MTDTQDNQPVRVRFAPSPTGHLHVGGARTALYNWLFARAHGGSFILRIEDTDLSRSTEAAIKQIINSMRWLGLNWDEGPEIGGDYGPYRQMERMELYRVAAGRLLNQGTAYHCYCTPEELEQSRQVAKAAGRPFIYSGRCRDLTHEQEQECRRQGREPVVRLKVPSEGITLVKDIIRGDVTFENALLGDFILMRSSGVPTYNFAVAVDDASMKVTHVIRGDDHLPNTPRQLLVLQALGEQAPLYGHLPLILGKDKAPLSKRHGAVSVEEFSAQGYLCEALCNYLALLGWSYDGQTTLFSGEELIEKFSLERIGRTAAVFDTDKLLWMNGHYLREMPAAELVGRISNFLDNTKLAGLPGKEGRPAVAELVPLVQEKMKTLADFVDLTDFFFSPLEFEPQAWQKLSQGEQSPEILQQAAAVLEKIAPFDQESIERALRQAAEEMGLKLGKFLQPLRIAVSGKTVTPGMFETLALLGREESLSRLRSALEKLAAS